MFCREQEKREERQRLKEQGVVLEDDPDGVGSFDDGDPHTTNLYIGGHLLMSILTKTPFGHAYTTQQALTNSEACCTLTKLILRDCSESGRRPGPGWCSASP